MADMTQITRLSYATGDNTLPLFCEDPSAQSKGTTDFCFDWLAPIEWGGALPASGSSLPVRNFGNLALDNAPLLGRDLAVTVEHTGGGTGATGDGHGLTINNGENLGYRLAKVGLAPETVANPKSEGFRDFYLDFWTLIRAPRPDGFNAGLMGQGQNANISYGLWINADGNVQDIVTNRIVRAATVGALIHCGVHFKFDTDADTTMLRLFVDGVEVGAADAFTSPSAWSAPVGQFGVGALGGYGAAKHTIARLTRTFTSWPGQGVLDPLELHRGEEIYNRPRLQ